MMESILWTRKMDTESFNGAVATNIKGYYLDDQRHGFGEMKWIDGYTYKGYW